MSLLIDFEISLINLYRDDKLGNGFYGGIFWDLFNIGIWDIFGEIYEPAKEGEVRVNCNYFAINWTRRRTVASTRQRRATTWTARSESIQYLWFSSAISFSWTSCWWTCSSLYSRSIASDSLIRRHVFDEIQAKSEEVWKYQMYVLLEEFYNKPLLPAPWVLLDLVIYRFSSFDVFDTNFRGLRLIFCSCCCRPDDQLDMAVKKRRNS